MSSRHTPLVSCRVHNVEESAGTAGVACTLVARETCDERLESRAPVPWDHGLCHHCRFLHRRLASALARSRDAGRLTHGVTPCARYGERDDQRCEPRTGTPGCTSSHSLYIITPQAQYPKNSPSTFQNDPSGARYISSRSHGIRGTQKANGLRENAHETTG